MKKCLAAVCGFVLLSLAGAEALFTHDIKEEKKPWNHERFGYSEEDFSFIILPDRTGNPRKGVFKSAVEKANMFNPSFIITVGDIIQGQMNIRHQDHDHLRKQWKEVRDFVDKSEVPFFYVVGNHDLARTRKGFPRAYETSYDVWKENFGTRTYYSFVYKNVLFLCLNHMEGRNAERLAKNDQVGLTDEQVKWALDTLEKHPDVRWTCVFIHAPGAWRMAPFKKIEKALQKRNYTVFSGDWHCYVKFQRYGRNYYVLGTAGGVSQLRGEEYGEIDHLTYVKMTSNGPRVVNVKLDGIFAEDAITFENNKTRDKFMRNLNIPVKKENKQKKDDSAPKGK